MKLSHMAIIAITVTGLVACKKNPEDLKLISEAKEIFGTIPAKMPGAENDNMDRIKLGQKLYFEKALSADGTISCNSCHNVIQKGSGTDNAPTSTGINGQKGGRNSPTVWNAGFHLAQFWDGRAKTLEDQAKGPILNPIEMGMPDADTVMKKLKGIEGYDKLFTKAFPEDKEPMTYHNLSRAIAAFERTLRTNDRFDRFMNGKDRSFGVMEKAGLRTFIDLGCAGCHNGPLLGGNSYQKLGVVNEYETSDLGRYEVTKKQEDKKVFKVPSLRNIAVTNPYFHDGSIKTLEGAIRKMAWHQLGKEISEEDTRKIVFFLQALTGKSMK